MKRRAKDHILKEQEFLVQQLELLNKESNNACGKELADLTHAMCKVLKIMSIPYALRFGILFAVIFQLLKGIMRYYPIRLIEGRRST